MTKLDLGIAGRLVVGETLKAWVAGPIDGLQWQAWINGQWVNVGTPNSASYVIPASQLGSAYRLVGTHDGAQFYSTASANVTADSKKSMAPVLSGDDLASLGLEAPGERSLFSWLTLTDADKANFAGGSLLLENSNALAHGGDGQDVLSIRFDSGPGQFSMHAATRDILYTAANGSVRVIGTLDASLRGNGTDLKVVFNNNATVAIVDALIDRLQYSNADDSPTEIRMFTLRVTDGSGASAQRVTTSMIQAQPDAPIIDSPSSFTVAENIAQVGTVLAFDPDVEAGQPQGITYSLAAGDGDTDNALFEIDGATGALRFRTAPDFEDALHAPGYSLRVRATDSEGSVAEQAVNVTVQDVNEAPLVMNGFGWAEEDGGEVTILPLVYDPDAGDSLSFAIDTTGTLGEVRLQDGAFVYDPAGRFEHLWLGGFTDRFNFTVTDSAGHAVTREVQVLVFGANDAPVVLGPGSGEVTESGHGTAGVAKAQGQLAASDVDMGDVLDWSGDAAGRYGDFTITHDGRWTYTLDNTRAATQALAQGEEAVETFAVTVADWGGGSAQTEVTIAVHGTNDAPVITASSDLAGVVAEPAVGTGVLRLDLGSDYDDARVLLDSAGRLVLAGRQTGEDGYAVPRLLRYFEDGSLDHGFGQQGGVTLQDFEPAAGVVQDAFGRYVVAGHTWSNYANSQIDWAVERYHPDGQLDTSFGGGRAVIDLGGYDFASKILSDGGAGVLVVGRGDGEQPQLLVVRLDESGQIDTGFGDQGWLRVAGTGLDVVADGQGRLLVWGPGEPSETGASQIQVSRFTAGGHVDESFGANGTVLVDLGGASTRPAQLAVGPDGAILLGRPLFEGDWQWQAAGLARLTEQGELDTGFGDGGRLRTDFHVRELQFGFDAEGRMLMAFSHPEVGDLHLARFLADGSLDLSFNVGGTAAADLGASESIGGIHIAAGGRILLSGLSSQAGIDLAFAAFDDQGRLDTRFGSPPPAAEISVSGSLYLAYETLEPGDSAAWSGSAAGLYGDFSITPQGTWTYVLDLDNPATQALEEGTTVTERFTATVTDSFGASDLRDIVITVVGSYDPPAA